MASNNPFAVVRFLELQEGKAEFLHCVEPPDPKQVLLQGPNEPLRDPIALRLSDEGWRTLDAQEEISS